MPGSFYRERSAWLHFHADPEGPFADVKLDGRHFERLRVSTRAEQAALLSRLQTSLAP